MSSTARGLARQLEAVQTVVSLINLPKYYRGLIAETEIQENTLLFQERPLVCTPAPTAIDSTCYTCLQPLQPLPQNTATTTTVNNNKPSTPPKFCSTECKATIAPWWDIEQQLFNKLDPLRQLCVAQRQKFPLMAARVASMTLAYGMKNQPPYVDNDSGTDHQHNTGGQLGMLVPRGNSLEDFNQLCFMNLKDTPADWTDAHTLLTNAIKTISLQPPVAKLNDDNNDNKTEHIWKEKLDMDWYKSLLTRMHLNVFRVDTIAPLDLSNPANFLKAAAATVSDSVASTQQNGSAVYLLSSMLNHSCEPNLDVRFPYNNATVGFVALRDIKKYEHLTISYVDTEMEIEKRREHLWYSYGFECGCSRCERESGGELPPVKV